MYGGTQVLPVVRIGFEFLFGAEREEIDLVDVRIIVLFLVERRARRRTTPRRTGIESSLDSQRTRRIELGFCLPSVPPYLVRASSQIGP